MAKRRTIGENPLELLMNPVPSPSSVAVAEKEISSNKDPEDLSDKKRITINVSNAILERTKNAVYWTPGLTLTALAEEALDAAVTELERKRGSEFPHRKEELKPGRPFSS